jgi:hypothetical protein
MIGWMWEDTVVCAVLVVVVLICVGYSLGWLG